MNKEEPKIFNFDSEKGKEIFRKTKNKIEVISSLDEFLKTEDEEKVREILKNRSICEQAIYSRGEQGNDYLDLLEKSFAFLLAKEFGQEKDIFSVSGDEIIKWLQETGLPEYILALWLEVAFHKKDRDIFFAIYNLISMHEKEIKDKSVVLRAEHDLASWFASKEKNQKQTSLLINKRIIKNSGIVGLRGEIDEKDLANIVEKARFGLTYNKELKPKDLIISYGKLAASLRELGNLQDATRALNEEAFAYLNLAKRQTKSRSDLKEKNLILAKDTALVALKYAINFNYINAEIKARKALAAVYKELGDRKKKKNYFKKTKELEEKYNYKF